ncbi:MAG: hypothetical protein ABSF70_05955 [Terracidiphilus sp.]
MTLDFLDDVLLLYLPFEPAQRIFERFAFLYSNLCQKIPPPNPPCGNLYDTGKMADSVMREALFPKNAMESHGIPLELFPTTLLILIWCGASKGLDQPVKE